MQLTSVAIYYVLERIGIPMSLNDVCVFVPTWFGGIASVLTGYMAAECSGIPSAAPAAALMMAIIPAHIMRSVGGGYDNESIAVSYSLQFPNSTFFTCINFLFGLYVCDSPVTYEALAYLFP
jgi:asparagine N-glycosylation enzyme membrane subunit Stt3